jgi:hypothetical protein
MINGPQPSYRLVEPIIAKESVELTVNTHFEEDNKTFVLRIKNMDTHEYQDFRIVLKNVNSSDVPSNSLPNNEVRDSFGNGPQPGAGNSNAPPPGEGGIV